MKKLLKNVIPMPIGCETLQYNACLASLVMKVEAYDDNVPYLCGRYHRYCDQCSDCGLKEFYPPYGKHTELYQLYTAVSGIGALSFDLRFMDMDYNQIVDILLDDYIKWTMGYLGYGYRELSTTLLKKEIFVHVKESIDKGYPALIQNKEHHTWSLVTGYNDIEDSILGYDGTYEYWNKSKKQADGYNDKVFYNSKWYEQSSRIVVVLSKDVQSISNTDVLNRLNKILKQIDELNHFDKVIEFITNDTLYTDISDNDLKSLRDKIDLYIGFHVDQRFMLSEAFGKTFYVAPELEAYQHIFNDMGATFRQTHDVCWDAWNAIGAFKKGNHHLNLLDKNIRTQIADDIGKIAENDKKVMSSLERIINQLQGDKL